jgi:DNA-binding IclR family transcriptional regulator
MSANELAPDLRRFVLTSVPSVPYLEAVLLLRAEPQHRWDVAELARRLYVPERTAAELLAELRARGIAVASGERVQYAPDAALAAMMDRIAQAYAADLVTITGLIHSRLDRRAQQFADAFRFRKD